MNQPATEAIDISDIYSAARRLDGIAVRTPLLESEHLNRLTGKRILVKAETLQRTGSFKFRGGWSAISSLDEQTRHRGVLAFSSGNHAQGVALAANIANTSAVIVMPCDAPALKIANTRSFGAEIVTYDRPAGEDREEIGRKLSQDRGLHLIKPYDNAQVMAGQGTCGLEIAEQAAALGVTSADVLVCCGGGGLTSGVALALHETAPQMQVFPVEPAGYDDVIRSLQSGRRESIHDSPKSLPATLCDAIVTPSPGKLTFPIIKRLCKNGFTVTDKQALHAMAEAMMRFKTVPEPGGAVALAAALNHADQLNQEVCICVLSGGNADPETLSRALSHFSKN